MKAPAGQVPVISGFTSRHSPVAMSGGEAAQKPVLDLARQS